MIGLPLITTHSHTNQYDWLNTHRNTQPHKPASLAYHSLSYTATQTSITGLPLIITHSHTNHWPITCHHSNHWFITQPHTTGLLHHHQTTTYHWLTASSSHNHIPLAYHSSSHSHIPLAHCIITQPHTTGLLHHHHTDIPLANHSSSSQKAHFSPTMKQTELCATSVCLCHFQH